MIFKPKSRIDEDWVVPEDGEEVTVYQSPYWKCAFRVVGYEGPKETQNFHKRHFVDLLINNAQKELAKEAMKPEKNKIKKREYEQV